jgi:hypothetical protein
LHRQLKVKSIIANFPEKGIFHFLFFFFQCYIFLTSKDARRTHVMSPVPSCIGKVETFLRLFFLFPFEDNKEKNGRLYSENTKLWVMCMGSLSKQVGELQGVVTDLKLELQQVK